MKKKNPQKLSSTDYEKLGRMLEHVFQSGYANKKQLYKMSFVKGVFSGLGGVVGATIVVGLLIWVLTILNYTPIRGLTEPIIKTIQPSEQ